MTFERCILRFYSNFSGVILTPGRNSLIKIKDSAICERDPSSRYNDSISKYLIIKSNFLGFFDKMGKILSFLSNHALSPRRKEGPPFRKRSVRYQSDSFFLSLSWRSRQLIAIQTNLNLRFLGCFLKSSFRYRETPPEKMSTIYFTWVAMLGTYNDMLDNSLKIKQI